METIPTAWKWQRIALPKLLRWVSRKIAPSEFATLHTRLEVPDSSLGKKLSSFRSWANSTCAMRRWQRSQRDFMMCRKRKLTVPLRDFPALRGGRNSVAKHEV